MRQYTRNEGNRASRLLSQLAADKKKTVIVLCLIGVMVFMWAKVLGKEASRSAEARERTGQTTSEGSGSQAKISFIEPPKVEGRNDALTRDFFDVEGWQEFMESQVANSDGTKAVNIVSRGGSKEVVKRVAGKLKLEAIGLSEKPEVFINDRLLTVGGKLLVKDGTETYECEVVRIERDMVLIRCGEGEIKLKLMQLNEVGD
ncbi:MAG: hypothetical protein JSV99_11530 [Planctomycetota bacterium]|nr:MAG: hypothetical protein JSV99_11530 [Planctomycetota bacterium]